MTFQGPSVKRINRRTELHNKEVLPAAPCSYLWFSLCKPGLSSKHRGNTTQVRPELEHSLIQPKILWLKVIRCCYMKSPVFICTRKYMFNFNSPMKRKKSHHANWRPGSLQAVQEWQSHWQGTIFSCSTGHMPGVTEHQLTHRESIPKLHACLSPGVQLHSRWPAGTMSVFVPKSCRCSVCVCVSLWCHAMLLYFIFTFITLKTRETFQY